MTIEEFGSLISTTRENIGISELAITSKTILTEAKVLNIDKGRKSESLPSIFDYLGAINCKLVLSSGIHKYSVTTFDQLLPTIEKMIKQTGNNSMLNLILTKRVYDILEEFRASTKVPNISWLLKITDQLDYTLTIKHI